MSKFRYEAFEMDGTGRWNRISYAEGDPKIVAVGMRATAELIAPSPSLGDVFRDVSNWVNDQSPEQKA